MRASLIRLSTTVLANCIASAESFLLKKELFGQEALTAVRFRADAIHERNGRIVFPFHVETEMTNAFHSMHGGAVATLADIFTTIHLWGINPQSKHVSSNFDISFVAPLKRNHVLECATRVVKNGKRMAFTEFTFMDEGGTLLAKGTHTKVYI